MWLSTITHCLNGTELSQEELWDNICLICGLMHHAIRGSCNGCGNNFSIDNALSFPKGGIFMERHDAAKEWISLEAQSIVLYSTSLKSTVGKYSQKGPGRER